MIRFLLDEETVELDQVPAELTVLDWLRLHRGRTGTKEGCGSGDCGACTVVMVSPDEEAGLRYEGVNACIALLGSLHGRQLLTVESLERNGRLHPVQQAMLDEHGAQCGFCTPGFVMSMFALCEASDAPRVQRIASDAEPDDPTPAKVHATPVAESRSPAVHAELDEAAHGDAVVVGSNPGASRPLSSPGGWLNGLSVDEPLALSHRIDRALGGNLCRCTGYRPIKRAAAVALAERCAWMDAGRTAALAERLRALAVTSCDEQDGYLAPHTLAEFAQRRLDDPDVPLVAGATDLALRITQRLENLPRLLSTLRVPELQRLERVGDVLHIGAAASLSRLQALSATCLPPLADLLLRYGSDPIRNVATLGGSLGSASPIGDLAPVLLALQANVALQRGENVRHVSIDDFFTGYRSTVLQPGEFIRDVQLPLPDDAALFQVHKISKRLDDDISTVCLAAHLTFDGDGCVSSARLGYGGMAATPARARSAEQALLGRALDDDALAEAAAGVAQDFAPIGDARASAGYRLRVAVNLLRRCQATASGSPSKVPTQLAALEPMFLDALHRPTDSAGS